MNSWFKDEAFGKNDLRGIVGQSITPELFEQVGKAFSIYINEHSDNKNDIWVSVAQDARSHSPGLTEALIKGLTSSGINVLDLGICPTPLAYFSEYVNLTHIGVSELAGAMIVTASHNPPEYNGLKLTYKKHTLSESEIAKLKEITRTQSGNLSDENITGIYKKYNIVPDYIKIISSSFNGVGKGIKIVVDSGNGTGGVVAPELYRKMGCEVIDIYSEPDGNFPNHHPDPSKEKNLVLLKEKIKEVNADFGIAFDGDSDRVGVIDNTGYSMPGDQLLLVFALDILDNLKVGEKKPVFISEVKCSQVLFDQIEENNGQAIMWKTGHAYIKSKMKEENAVLAGEMSGHIFFKDRYYGYDDAVYAGCRFIEITAKNRAQNPDFKISDLIDDLPKAYTSRELRMPCPNELKYEVIEHLKDQVANDPDIFNERIEDLITIDGLRIIFDKGFALIRASNTEPTFTLRFEGESQEDSDRYKEALLRVLDDTLEELRSGIV